MRIAEFLSQLESLRHSGRGWSARCPAHDDHANNLSVAIGDEGRVLVNCFAGCRPEAIVRAIGLELRDLFGDAPTSASRRRNIPTSSVLEAARRDVIREAMRLLARLPLADYQRADELRWCDQLVQRARAIASESADGWDLLEQAARLERMTMAAEATA